MIEPQNTMMPLPAASAAADAPQGEAGFGEMLAQTLGAIPQLDPAAVARIMREAADQDHSGSEEGDSSEPGSAGVGGVAPARSNEEEYVSAAQYVAMPVDGVVPAAVSETITLPRPPVVDTPVTDPEFDEGSGGSSPVETIEVPLAPEPMPVPTPPADGIWKPVLSDDPTALQPAQSEVLDHLPEVELQDHVAADSNNAGVRVSAAEQDEVSPDLVAAPSRPSPTVSAARPEPAPRVPAGPEDPAELASGARPTGDTGLFAAETVRNMDPEHAVKKPSDPVGSPGLPVEPTPTFGRTEAPLGGSAVTTPRVDLTPDVPVRFSETEVKLGTGSVTVPDSPTNADTTASSPATGMPAVGSVQQQGMPTTDFARPVAPSQHSALAERVMQAVELQANQPPPRTMVVDIPEIEGLRLVVSVRSGAEVHVVPSTSSTASSGLQPFLDELQGVLANRGFVMTGDGGRRGWNQDSDEQPEPRSTPRPMFRRPRPTDNDLRI